MRDSKKPSSRNPCALVLSLFALALWLVPPARGETLAYIPGFDGNLNLIDLEVTPELPLAPVAVGTQPLGIAIDAARKRAFITDLATDELLILDVGLPTPRLLGAVIVGDEPGGVVFHPNGRYVYITNFAAGTLSVVDLQASPPATVSTLPVGLKPDGIVLRADGSRAYLVDADDGLGDEPSEVHILDTSTQPPVALGTVAVGPEAHGLALGPGETFLYVPSAEDNTLRKIDLTLNPPQVVDSEVVACLRPYAVAVSPNGARAFVTCIDDNSVAIVNLAGATMQAEGSLAVGELPFSIDVSPDSTRAFAVNGLSGSISVIDALATPPTILRTLTVGSFPIGWGRFIASPFETMFTDGFETGDTSAWSLTVP